MIRGFLLFLASLCGLTNLQGFSGGTPASPVAQERRPPILEFVSYRNADEIGNPRNMMVSPDAAKLAWTDRDGLCIFEIDTETQTCVGAEDVHLTAMSGFAWSPDSRYIAFHEDLILRFDESDLWVFDVEHQMFTNLTDDGLAGSVLDAQDSTEFVPLDYMPFWDGSNLYFVRANGFNVEETATGIYRLSLADGVENVGEPELVADLTSALPIPLSLYDLRRSSLDGGLALSPDGRYVAFLSRPPEGADTHEVWLLDLDSGNLERLATYGELTAYGLPEWQEAEFFLSGVAWNGDGTHLIITTLDSNYGGLPSPVYTVEIASGTISTLLDFTDVADEASLYSVERAHTGYTARYDTPVFAVTSPDGSYFIYFNFDGIGNAGISALSLLPPVANDTPIRLYEVEDELGPQPMDTVSAGENDEFVRVLMNGYLFTFAKS
jgi:Tol biopolymer transport system component